MSKAAAAEESEWEIVEPIPAELQPALDGLATADGRNLSNEDTAAIAHAYSEAPAGTLAVIAKASDPNQRIGARIRWVRGAITGPDPAHRSMTHYAPVDRYGRQDTTSTEHILRLAASARREEAAQRCPTCRGDRWLYPDADSAAQACPDCNPMYRQPPIVNVVD